MVLESLRGQLPSRPLSSEGQKAFMDRMTRDMDARAKKRMLIMPSNGRQKGFDVPPPPVGTCLSPIAKISVKPSHSPSKRPPSALELIERPPFDTRALQSPPPSKRSLLAVAITKPSTPAADRPASSPPSTLVSVLPSSLLELWTREGNYVEKTSAPIPKRVKSPQKAGNTEGKPGFHVL